MAAALEKLSLLDQILVRLDTALIANPRLKTRLGEQARIAARKAVALRDDYDAWKADEWERTLAEVHPDPVTNQNPGLTEKYEAPRHPDILGSVASGLEASIHVQAFVLTVLYNSAVDDAVKIDPFANTERDSLDDRARIVFAAASYDDQNDDFGLSLNRESGDSPLLPKDFAKLLEFVSTVETKFHSTRTQSASSDETCTEELDDPNEPSITYDGEMVTFRVRGEKVSLKDSLGVQRLIRIVCSENGTADAMELWQIGANQSDRRSNSSSYENGLTERSSPNGPLGKALGDGSIADIRKKVEELIEKKKDAESRGDCKEASRIGEKINATLDRHKNDLSRVAKIVQNSLNRTYERLRKSGGKKLSEHFSQQITRPFKSPDFIYGHSNESKMTWIQK